MNILMLSWRGSKHPLAGGAEESAHQHAKAWAKVGHNITLFTSLFQGGKKTEIIDGVKIIRKGGDVFGVQIQAFLWYLFGKHPKFDLVVDEFHGIPFFTPLYVRAKKLAFIHEVAKEVWWFNPWPKPFNLIPAIIGTVFERFIFMILYRRTPFMTVSESTRGELVAWGIPKRNISVIHNGVSVVKVDVKKEKRNTLIYLGALTRDKGIEDAIKVFVLINQKDPDWQFWVVGKGEKEYLKALGIKVRQAGLDKKVKFWGFVDQRAKFELLAMAHVLVNPSIREGWGLVNIEANSVGTPVVGYKVPGMKDSVRIGETGYLFDNGNIDVVAQKVMALSKDKKTLAELSRKCISWSKKFSWSKSGQMSLKLVGSI